MKKLLLVLAVLLIGGPMRPAFADDNILFNLGPVKVLLPFADVSATYLFDATSKQSLVGAETPLIAWHKLSITGGAITSLEGAGNPFVGANLDLTNPLPNFTSLAGIKPGLFGGYDFSGDGGWMVGFKASVSIFN